MQFNEKTLNEKQKLSVVLSREHHCFQRYRFIFYIQYQEKQGLAGKFTATKQPLLPGFNILAPF